MLNVWVNGCHPRFVFVAVIVGIGLEWNSVRAPKVVQPGCTATTNRIQVGEMPLHEAVEAYKKEGPKFMQRLLAKQKTSVMREYALQTEASVDSSRITGNPDIIR